MLLCMSVWYVAISGWLYALSQVSLVPHRRQVVSRELNLWGLDLNNYRHALVCAALVVLKGFSGVKVLTDCVAAVDLIR